MRIVKLIEDFEDTGQSAERGFDLAHNARSGKIIIPDESHDQTIHQSVRALLGGPKGETLRRFQENFVKMDQIITVSGVVIWCHILTYASARTRRKAAS
jgi:hypothetical protein